MKLPSYQLLQMAADAGALSAAPLVVRKQAYPTRPVRMIVPSARGGHTDVTARLIAQKLSQHLGKEFYVENIVGGNIGTGRVAQATPNGYTALVVDGTSYVFNTILYNKAPYNPDDFGPVALAVTTTQVVTVHPSLPVRTVKDLVGLINANSGKYSYASAGIGSASHLVGELFRVSLDLNLVHVPFNGEGPAVNSTVAGHTPITFGSPASSVPQIKEGNLRALAVATKTRLHALPDVPTMPEAGFPDIECDAWVGVLVPAGTPRKIIALLNREIVKIVALPDVKRRLTALGVEAVADTPEEFAARIRTDITKWTKIIRAAGIKAD
jgi:tripartite-type tricarboxylate transporter receptor subunit TctC